MVEPADVRIGHTAAPLWGTETRRAGYFAAHVDPVPPRSSARRADQPSRLRDRAAERGVPIDVLGREPDAGIVRTDELGERQSYPDQGVADCV